MAAAVIRTWQPQRAVAWVVAVLVLVLAVFWQTAWSMVQVWQRSDTYSHGYLIVPVFLWLVWERRRTLSRLPLNPSWFGLFALAGMGLGWLAGDLAAAPAPSQFAVVAMVPAAIATILGAAWGRALGFPLAFLFLAVPFGESMIPTLMDWTADFTVVALKLSGVPVYRVGTHFSLPSGDWSVIEACSGIRYVIACVTAATLYAWTVYRSTARRLLFVSAAIAIAIISNWIRAYATVMAAHLSDNRIGTGRDHIVFAEVLFGVVIAVVLGLGTLWREDQPSKPESGGSIPTSGPATGSTPAASAPRRSLLAALTAAATLSVWPLISVGTEGEMHSAPSTVVEIEPRAGWVRIDEAAAKWQPQLSNPSQVRLQTFVKEGRQVSVHLGIFDRPTRESKLTSSANQLVASQDLHWKLVERGVAEVHRRGEVIPVKTGTLVGRGSQIIAWHWYWVDGTKTTSPARATLLQMLARLRGRNERSAWVTVYTTENDPLASAALVLQVFLSDMLSSIDGAVQPTVRDSERILDFRQ